MRAVAACRFLPVEDPGCFEVVDLPCPVPGPADLLVRVRAVSVNPIDAKLRSRIAGTLPTPLVLGFDGTGTVEAMGDEVVGFGLGDEVYYAGDLRRPGSNAELQCVDYRLAARKPVSQAPEQAAAVPLVALTAWESLFEHLQIPFGQEREREPAEVLLIGAAGGVGTMAMRLLRALTAVRVIATASSPESRDWCREQGADIVLDHRQALPPQLRDAGIGGVGRVLCMAPPNHYLEQVAELITPFGRLCCLPDADQRQPLQIHSLKAKSAAFMWEFMFARVLAGGDQMARQGAILGRVAALLEEGTLTLPPALCLGRMDPAVLASAHGRMEAGHNRGKLTVTWDMEG